VQLGGVPRRLPKDVLALTRKVPAFVACLDNGLESDAVGRGAGRVAAWMSLRPATELEDGIVAEDGNQVRHMPGMNAAGGRREHRGERCPGLIEVHSAAPVGGNEIFAQ